MPVAEQHNLEAIGRGMLMLPLFRRSIFGPLLKRDANCKRAVTTADGVCNTVPVRYSILVQRKQFSAELLPLCYHFP
jgi:hypothetical protein